jgi:proline racemase/trans-L-3-hydroxyproline dehydratase
LYAKGKLNKGEGFRYKSILGTEFQGEIVGETEVGSYKAIVPEITGSAHITGIQQLIADRNDPFREGFLL